MSSARTSITWTQVSNSVSTIIDAQHAHRSSRQPDKGSKLGHSGNYASTRPMLNRDDAAKNEKTTDLQGHSSEGMGNKSDCMFRPGNRSSRVIRTSCTTENHIRRLRTQSIRLSRVRSCSQRASKCRSSLQELP